jgi:hypothetical protein
LIKRIWDIITSRNLAIVLLVTVTVMLAVGAFLPNPSFMSETDLMLMKIKYPVITWLGERYNSQTLASGYLFGFIGVFLVISTVLCSINRLIKGNLGGGKEFVIPSYVMSKGIRRNFKRSDIKQVETVSGEWLRSHKWRVSVADYNGDRIVVGSRGRAGFRGSIFFHFILITALGGLVFYHLGGYRATFSFTEGESYRLTMDSPVHIIREPLWGLRLPDAEVGLIKQYSIYPESDPWNAVEHVALFRVMDFNEKREWNREVRINEPLVIDGKKFLLTVGGFSPKIVIKDKAGRTLVNSYVALKDKAGTSDSFELMNGDLVEARVYPEFYMEGDEPATRSMQGRNPFLHIKIDTKGTYSFEEFIPFKNKAQAGEFTVFFPELRKWVEMELVGEPGIGFFFFVSFIGLIALLVRGIDPDERIYIQLKEERDGIDMNVYPYSKHFSGLIKDSCIKLVSYLDKKYGEGGTLA